LNLHEYQAKALFAEYGIPIPTGRVAASPAEARDAAESLGGKLWVVKAQVHAGGRGKAGGVKLARSPAEVESAAREMLGKQLVTRQTAKEGLPVDKVYVERGSSIARELYLSMLVDRSAERIAIIASAAGGMDIEEVAKETPEKILTVKLHPVAGIQDYQTRELGFGLALVKEQQTALRDILRKLVKLMHECDASLVEVNPLIVTTDGAVVALDAKINIEDNALFRQPKLAEMRDVAQEDALERRAREHDLSYVSLDGSIACLVNGAGLAMATMDLIKLHGGEPANFLDVGGGATAERVEEAFNIILANRNVKAILVNIFGGIVRCDLIAEGVIAAIKKADVRVPIVVRLEGTNVDKGMELLRASGLAIVAATGLTDAASKAVELSRSAQRITLARKPK
jgi:succinyl-CoA synthetase beta subunit